MFSVLLTVDCSFVGTLPHSYLCSFSSSSVKGETSGKNPEGISECLEAHSRHSGDVWGLGFPPSPSLNSLGDLSLLWCG